MMIHDFQPYSFVEGKGFIKLMHQLEPCCEIPHRTTFSRSVVPSIYKEVKQQVEWKLTDVQQSKSKLALTTDMWTSEANDAYLGLSCHYLTANFELVSLCLAVEHFTGRHTGANIASCLNRFLLITIMTKLQYLWWWQTMLLIWTWHCVLESGVVDTALAILCNWPLMMALKYPHVCKRW